MHYGKRRAFGLTGYGHGWRGLARHRHSAQGAEYSRCSERRHEPRRSPKAIAAGVNGIVISNYSTRAIPGVASPIEMLPVIADAVGGKAPILIDGSLRLGSDVFKALVLGAQAVLLGRPTIWGLAAYGEQGVQDVIELIQSEFARDMAMCGKVNLKALRSPAR